MPKRHEALIPLTHDHHHTLAQARRLREASGVEEQKMRRAADDFVNFYLGRARHHFHEEEELFFAPVVDDERAGPLVARALTEHLRLHALVRNVRRDLATGKVDGEVLLSIAEILESHVRFEEQELFPLIEEIVPEAELLDLATTGRRDV